MFRNVKLNLNETSNTKKCGNKRSFKSIFTNKKKYRKKIGSFFNWIMGGKKTKVLIKKTRKFFWSSDFRFEISTKKRFRKNLLPDALFSKIFSYGSAALWLYNCISAKIFVDIDTISTIFWPLDGWISSKPYCYE